MIPTLSEEQTRCRRCRGMLYVAERFEGLCAACSYDDNRQRAAELEGKKLSQKFLEDLVCCIIKNAKDDKGLVIALHPWHVLQPWVLNQMPHGLRHPREQFSGLFGDG